MGRSFGVLAIAFAALVAAAPSASAQSGDLCLTANPPPIDAPAHRLRFGITPLAAGSILPSNPKPENADAALRAAQRLRPGRRQLVMRLNRMFMSEGEAGIRRFASIVDRYAKAGLSTRSSRFATTHCPSRRAT
jgi:hypothetical protein